MAQTDSRRAALTLGAAAAVLASLAAPVAAHAQAATYQFDIPQQPMASALRAFAQASRQQVVFDGAVVRDKESPGVTGRLTADSALQALISGSGLRVRRTATGVVYVEPAGPQDVAGEPAALDDVVVTGTHIRDGINRTTPVIGITRAEIEQSGYSSPEQLIQSLPQNYAGGQNGASEYGRYGNSPAATFNLGAASGVNLRGLGTTSTLTLINGRRVAPTIRGSAVDISLIPLGAIDRVDVLTDGASAVYGSDAVAGVVNFVLRKDFEGAETRARYGSVTDGPTQESMISQALGTTWEGGGGFVSLQRRTRDRLPSSDRSFAAGAIQPNDLLPETEDISAVFDLRQSLGDQVEVFAFGLGSRKESERRQRSTAQNGVHHTTSTFYAVTGGLSYAMTDRWTLDVSASFSEQLDKNAQIYDPPFAPVHIRNAFELWTVDATASGPVLQLPGGPLRAAVGVTYREEQALYLTPFLNDRLTRDARAAFVEVYAPLVGPDNAMTGIERLELSAAVRYDEFSDFGETTNPRIGIYWKPVADLEVRAAYSSSFHAPSVGDLFGGATNSNIFAYPFARATGAGVQTVFLLTGGTQNLQPETADTFTSGVTWNPAALSGFSLSLEYYAVDFKDRIITPPVDTRALQHPEIYGSLITSFADDAAAAAFLAARLAEGFVPYGVVAPAGVRYAYDARLQNAAAVEQRGLDIRASYSFALGDNRFNVQANLAYIDTLDTAFSPGSTPADILDTYGSPLSHRLRSALSWSRGPINATAALNYQGEYRDTAAVPVRTVEAWTTTDLVVTYSPPAFSKVGLTFSALNLFDEDPPYVQGLMAGIHFDGGNATPLGRFVSAELRVRW